MKNKIILTLRGTEKEYELLAAQARAEGLSMNEMVRRKLELEPNRTTASDKGPRGRKIGYLKEKQEEKSASFSE